MPRKRVSGRARTTTAEARFLLTLDQVNRKLRQLDVNQVYGVYSAKKMLNAIKEDKVVDYSRKRRNEKIRIDVKNLTAGQLRYYTKVFRSFLQSKSSSKLGIQEIRSKTEKHLAETLGNLVDRQITKQDVDEFYELVADEDFRYLADKIGDSEMYILLNACREQKWSEPKFIDTISQYITTNNADVRKIAERLYDKFIIGMDNALLD